MSTRHVAILACVALGFLIAGLNADCSCKFQGSQLTGNIYNQYPSDDPGKYQNFSGIKIYGTTCAAWDQVPGTPWFSYCPAGSDWSDKDYNWCQQPWCYVDESCADAVPSSVFKGSDVAFFSYLACGYTADCYTNIAWNATYVWPTGCPYDPNGGQNYKVHKAGNCKCMFQGAQLGTDIYTDYPSDDKGKYANMASIQFYGTTCAAWDQMPDTPWFSYCPAGSDWCHPDYNWCQQPWCYVDKTCSSGVSSSVFKGSPVAFYSYNTCLSSPDCYTDIAWNANWSTNSPQSCPFDSADNKWYTAKACPDGWTQPSTPSTTTVAEEGVSASTGQRKSTFNLLVVFAPFVVVGATVAMTGVAV